MSSEKRSRKNKKIPPKSFSKKKYRTISDLKNKIFFISLGCPRNLVDSEVMLGILLKSGYEISQEMEKSDCIIINTCGFIKESREEAIETIGQCIKKRKKGSKVIATGCMVQTHSKEIKAHYPEIDFLLGSGDIENILKAIESPSQGEEITSAKSYLENGEIPRIISTPPHLAYLKIAEGCRKRCSYCIIPNIKGDLESKNVEQILKEFQTLLKQGTKEIILIAQDLGDWGKDLGYRNGKGLIHLLREMLKVKKNYWLRLLYLYPDEIDKELISLIKSDPRICPYLDMPIQHVNNEILKFMRRSTSKEKIISSIHALREEIPDISIRTSFIVGFPGETEEQFKELEQFVKEYSLNHVGVFKYSKEAGSHAATLPNQIDDSLKEKRYNRLMRIQKKNVEKQNKRFIGKKIQVLLEGYHPDSSLLMRGRHQGQCADIDSIVIINDARKAKGFGEWHTVEITDTSSYDLIGKII